MHIRIQQQEVAYQIEGDTQPADDRVLLAADTDLTAGQPWSAAGYVVAPFLTEAENTILREGLAEKVRGCPARRWLSYSCRFASGTVSSGYW